MKPTHVSVTEAADMLDVTVSYVRRLLRDGELEGFKLNERAWAVSRESVEKKAKESRTAR